MPVSLAFDCFDFYSPFLLNFNITDLYFYCEKDAMQLWHNSLILFQLTIFKPLHYCIFGMQLMQFLGRCGSNFNEQFSMNFIKSKRGTRKIVIICCHEMRVFINLFKVFMSKD